MFNISLWIMPLVGSLYSFALVALILSSNLVVYVAHKTFLTQKSEIEN